MDTSSTCDGPNAVVKDIALGRGHRNSRLLWKIIAFIWLIVTLSEVKSTLKVRGVSTDHCNCTKTEVWLNLPRRFGLRFIDKKRSKGYFGSRLTRYPNSTSTFQLERLTESGDINPNPGPEKCPFCNRTIASNHRGLCCSSCSQLMHIKCANVRPNQFTQLISRNIALWRCPGCVLFSELPFYNLDSKDFASEFGNDGNDLLKLGQNFACEVYANQDDILNPLGESQASTNNDLIAERNKHNKEVLMCHLNINSIQNKFEELLV